MANNGKKASLWLLVLLLSVLVALGTWEAGQRVLSGFLSPFSCCVRYVCGFCSRVFLNRELAELGEAEKQVAELEVASAEIEVLREENRQLRSLMKLPGLVSWEPLFAEIMRREPVTWNWECLIGKGEKDGVVPGEPVLFGPYLAGRVVTVDGRSAKVALLGNPRCRLSVFVKGRLGVYPGVLYGTGGLSGNYQMAQIDYLDKDAVIEDGDQVVSSGMGQEVPAGIPVGTVCGETVLVGKGRRQANVSVFVDVRKVKFLTVMLKKEGRERAEKDGEDGVSGAEMEKNE